MTNDNDPPAPAEVTGLADQWENKYERPRGIVTDLDRQFLWGVKEYNTPQQRSNRRAEIRERVKNGLLDLSYLTMLEDNQRDRVLDEIDEESKSGALRSSVASLIQFLYLGLDTDVEWFEETVAHGIINAESELTRKDDDTYYLRPSLDIGVDVDITVKRGYNVDELEGRLRSGAEHTLTPTEIGVLVREGRVSEEKLRALNSQTTERIDPETGELEDPGMNPAFGGPDPQPRDTPDPHEGEDGKE